MEEYIMKLFKAFRIAMYGMAFYMILMNGCYIHYIFKGKKQGKTLAEYVGKFFSKKRGVILCEIILLLGIIFYPPIFERLGNTNIGSFFEKESYEEQYFVYIRESGNKSKSYKVKADILKSNYGHPSWEDDGEETYDIHGNGYFIKKVYWSNGGYLNFEDYDHWGYPTENQIYPGKETLCYDSNDDGYYIFLTNEKVR